MTATERKTIDNFEANPKPLNREELLALSAARKAERAARYHTLEVDPEEMADLKALGWTVEVGRLVSTGNWSYSVYGTIRGEFYTMGDSRFSGRAEALAEARKYAESRSQPNWWRKKS